MTLDSTAYDAVLKDYYTRDKIEEQSFFDNPFYAMVPKKMAGGRRYPQPVEYGRPTNANATFTTAMTNATNSKYEDFLLTRVKQYQRVLVDHEMLLATEKADEAFQPAFDEFDKGFRGLGEKMARRLYRTSTGSIGQMANSSVATTVITLADKADAFNFEVDTVLQFSDTDGSALLDSGETLTVTAVDPEEGTVTVNANLNNISGIGTNDFIYIAGDHNLGLSGLEDWLPAGSTRGTKLAASFFGVTRSANPQRLGGVYMDGTTLGGIDEILIKLVAKQAKYGGRPSHVFMNPETFSDLQLLANGKTFISQSIETKVPGENGDYVIGFPGLKVNIGGFNVRVYGDVNCPSNRIYSLQMNTWKLWHTGPLPNFQGEKFTGRILKPAETEDSMEARIAAYCQLGCSAPGKNAVAAIPVA